MSFPTQENTVPIGQTAVASPSGVVVDAKTVNPNNNNAPAAQAAKLPPARSTEEIFKDLLDTKGFAEKKKKEEDHRRDSKAREFKKRNPDQKNQIEKERRKLQSNYDKKYVQQRHIRAETSEVNARKMQRRIEWINRNVAKGLDPTKATDEEHDKYLDSSVPIENFKKTDVAPLKKKYRKMVIEHFDELREGEVTYNLSRNAQKVRKNNEEKKENLARKQAKKDVVELPHGGVQVQKDKKKKNKGKKGSKGSGGKRGGEKELTQALSQAIQQVQGEADGVKERKKYLGNFDASKHSKWVNPEIKKEKPIPPVTEEQLRPVLPAPSTPSRTWQETQRPQPLNLRQELNLTASAAARPVIDSILKKASDVLNTVMAAAVPGVDTTKLATPALIESEDESEDDSENEEIMRNYHERLKQLIQEELECPPLEKPYREHYNDALNLLANHMIKMVHDGFDPDHVRATWNPQAQRQTGCGDHIDWRPNEPKQVRKYLCQCMWEERLVSGKLKPGANEKTRKRRERRKAQKTNPATEQRAPTGLCPQNEDSVRKSESQDKGKLPKVSGTTQDGQPQVQRPPNEPSTVIHIPGITDRALSKTVLDKLEQTRREIDDGTYLDKYKRQPSPPRKPSPPRPKAGPAKSAPKKCKSSPPKWSVEQSNNRLPSTHIKWSVEQNFKSLPQTPGVAPQVGAVKSELERDLEEIIAAPNSQPMFNQSEAEKEKVLASEIENNASSLNLQVIPLVEVVEVQQIIQQPKPLLMIEWHKPQVNPEPVLPAVQLPASSVVEFEDTETESESDHEEEQDEVDLEVEQQINDDHIMAQNLFVQQVEEKRGKEEAAEAEQPQENAPEGKTDKTPQVARGSSSSLTEPDSDDDESECIRPMRPQFEKFVKFQSEFCNPVKKCSNVLKMIGAPQRTQTSVSNFPSARDEKDLPPREQAVSRERREAAKERGTLEARAENQKEEVQKKIDMLKARTITSRPAPLETGVVIEDIDTKLRKNPMFLLMKFLRSTTITTSSAVLLGKLLVSIPKLQIVQILKCLMQVRGIMKIPMVGLASLHAMAGISMWTNFMMGPTLYLSLSALAAAYFIPNLDVKATHTRTLFRPMKTIEFIDDHKDTMDVRDQSSRNSNVSIVDPVYIEVDVTDEYLIKRLSMPLDECKCRQWGLRCECSWFQKTGVHQVKREDPITVSVALLNELLSQNMAFKSQTQKVTDEEYKLVENDLVGRSKRCPGINIHSARSSEVVPATLQFALAHLWSNRGPQTDFLKPSHLN